MLKKRFVRSIIFSVTLTLFIYTGIEQIKVQSLKNITSEVVQSKSFNYIIQSANAIREKSTVKINLSLVDQYDNLSAFKQFAVFEFLNRQVRDHLLRDTFQNSLYNYDFEIIGNTKKNNYRFDNPVSNKQLAHNTEGTFQINGENIYSKSTFKRKIREANKKIITSHEQKILDDAEKVFLLISSLGKYHHHSSDSKIVYDALEKRFGITQQEYLKLFEKSYLGKGFEKYPLFKDTSE
ncbi:hypothetical protein [Bacillus testis]|uniref:hypothetical protein n=1 Tax=Bacillus testis TaxID=1622072 RepID=UPI00067F6CB0|nr:hypothetical protein [Bacillus testis]